MRQDDRRAARASSCRRSASCCRARERAGRATSSSCASTPRRSAPRPARRRCGPAGAPVPGLFARRRVDRHGMAGHDGGRGAQRPRGRARGARGGAPTADRAAPVAPGESARGDGRERDSPGPERRLGPGPVRRCADLPRGARGPRGAAPIGARGAHAAWVRAAPRARPRCDRQGQDGRVALTGFVRRARPRARAGRPRARQRVRGPHGTVECADPAILAGVLRRGGLRVHDRADRLGPAARARRARAGPARTGAAIAVDMESAWLAPAAGARPLVALRGARHPRRGLAPPAARRSPGAARAYRALRGGRALVQEWADALGSRQVVLAGPRASCAGVERAIEVVERALERHGRPLYVRRRSSTTPRGRATSSERGAVFVGRARRGARGRHRRLLRPRRLPGGPARGDRARARRDRRHLPPGGKVHAEARRFAARATRSCSSATRATTRSRARSARRPSTHRDRDRRGGAQVEVDDPDRVAYLTQTTLAVDETAEVVDALCATRFPSCRRAALRRHLLRHPEPPGRRPRARRGLRR